MREEIFSEYRPGIKLNFLQNLNQTFQILSVIFSLKFSAWASEAVYIPNL